jgi:hypothetical protein
LAGGQLEVADRGAHHLRREGGRGQIRNPNVEIRNKREARKSKGQSARGAREKNSQIEGTMFWREGRKTWAFGAGIVPRLFHMKGAGRRQGNERERGRVGWFRDRVVEERSGHSLGKVFFIEREK